MLSDANRRLLSKAIHSQLGAPHSLAALAALVNMDVRRFTQAFRRSFGMSAWQYLLRVRLEEAARLLATTHRPITAIALEVGFATPSHFTATFARRFGMSPSRYRKRADESDSELSRPAVSYINDYKRKNPDNDNNVRHDFEQVSAIEHGMSRSILDRIHVVIRENSDDVASELEILLKFVEDKFK